MADVFVAVGDDDHRAVLEVPYSLGRLLALAYEAQSQTLTGKVAGSHRGRDLVHVDDRDPLGPGDAREVVVHRDDDPACVPRKTDELAVDAGYLGIVGFEHLGRSITGQ